eukprot:m.907555 g.907555  ORF g.907555 m.907555 type:complete len:133 (+) comp60092_c0_seq6:1715-2113(+)
MAAIDTDQEVKERAILALATLIAIVGDMLGGLLQPAWPIFLARLQNELTRLAATKAIALLSQSALQIDFGPIIVDTIKGVFFSLTPFSSWDSRHSNLGSNFFSRSIGNFSAQEQPCTPHRRTVHTGCPHPVI